MKKILCRTVSQFIITAFFMVAMLSGMSAEILKTDDSISFNSINPMADGEQFADEIRKMVFKYSPDGKYILEKAAESGSMSVNDLILRWSDEKNPEAFFGTLDTAVHEEYHGFQGRRVLGNTRRLIENSHRELVDGEIINIPLNNFIPETYKITKTTTSSLSPSAREELADKIMAEIPGLSREQALNALNNSSRNSMPEQSQEYRNLIKTEEATSKIPERLRTFRWETYVSPGAAPSANISGAYGLLMELSAYYYGIKTTIDCHDYINEYLDKKRYSKDLIQGYIQSFINGGLSFYEFKFWTLEYLLYLQERHPEHYTDFMDNEVYRTTFIYFHDKFQKLVEETIPANIKVIINKLNGMNIKSSEDERWVRISGAGLGKFTEQINLLKNEMSLPKYKKMMDELRKSSPDPITTSNAQLVSVNSQVELNNSPEISKIPVRAGSEAASHEED